MATLFVNQWPMLLLVTLLRMYLKKIIVWVNFPKKKPIIITQPMLESSCIRRFGNVQKKTSKDFIVHFFT